MTVKRAAWVVLAAALYALPASGLLAGWGLDRAQGLGLGVVLLALCLWVSEAVPLFVTGAAVALLGASTLAPVTGEPSASFVLPFASDITLLFLGGFVLSELMREHGVDQLVARRVLARVGTQPRRVMIGVLGTTALLSMWMSNTAAAAMMLAMLGALSAPIPQGDGLRPMLVLAVAAGANLGGMGTPIGTPPNAVAIAAMTRVGVEPPSFLLWIVLVMPVLLTALWGVSRLLWSSYPTQVTSLALPGDDPPWTPAAAWTSAIVGLTALLWFTEGLHPLSPGTVGLLPLIAAFGSGLLSPDHINRLPWDVLGVVGGGLCLGVVVDQSGLDQWVLAGAPTTGAGPLAVLLLLAAAATALSTIMSNTAAANLVLPIALALPDPSLSRALAVALACSAAMALPISTPPNTMALATQAVTSRDFMRTGAGMTAISLGATLVVGLPWWTFVAWLR